MQAIGAVQGAYRGLLLAGGQRRAPGFDALAGLVARHGLFQHRAQHTPGRAGEAGLG
jgi:hypothetical protein